jgi:hypothetical protein
MMNFATQSSVSDWPFVLKPRSRRSIQLSCLRIRLMLIGCISGWCSCLWDTEKERKGLGSQGGNRGFMYLRFGPRKGYLALRLYPWGLYKRVQPEPQINSVAITRELFTVEKTQERHKVQISHCSPGVDSRCLVLARI